MTLQEAVALLAAINDGKYDGDTNPYGLDGTGGMDANLVDAFNAIATVGGGLFSAAVVPAATSQTSRTIGAGTFGFTLDIAVTLPAGLYLICPPDELGNPVNFFLGYLVNDLVESTALSVVVSAGAYGGSGSHGSWAIAALPVKAGGFRDVSGSDTQLAADRGGVVRYTGTGGHTETLLAASSAGNGFDTTFIHRGSGLWTVGTARLLPKQSVTLLSNGSSWDPKAGYRSRAAIHAAIRAL